MDTVLIDHGIETIRSMIAADGGDIEVVRIDQASGVVALRLVLEDAHCRECVMPREFLEPIALDMLASAEPKVLTVSIDDPRD